MRVLQVVASFGGLCLLGLLAGGCAVPGGPETAATLPAIPSRVVQAGGQGTEPSPATVTPRPSLTPAATRTPAVTPTSTPSPQPSPTDTPAPGLPTASPSLTQTPSPPQPTATKTPMPPPASATPSATSPPTATASPVPASPAPGAHRFLPAGPVRPDPSHPCGCPRAPAYIVGRITDAVGNPLTGVRLACYNEWYRYPVVASKASGEYDFAITQAQTTWTVVVLNQMDEPNSPEIPVAFDPQECCRYLLDWRRVD